LHGNIYLALKYQKKIVFLCEQHHADENISANYITVCATRGYINTSLGPGSGVFTTAQQVYKINAFYTEMFSHLFLMVTSLQCPIKAINVTYGNSFSKQWAFTMLETEVFKYKF